MTASVPPRARGTVVAFFVFLATGLVGLDAAPRMFGDEAWYAMPTVSLLREGALRLSALEGRGGVEVAYLQPKILPNLLAAPVVALAGVSLWAFRLTALLCGAAALLGVDALARRRFDADTGFVATILLAGSYWFLACARCFRPEVFELTALVWFAYTFDRALASRYIRDAAWAGLAAAATCLTHQTSVVLVGALALALLLDAPFERPRLRAAALTALIALVALAPYGLYVALASRHPGVSAHAQFTGEADERLSTLYGVTYFELLRWRSYFLWPYGVTSALVAVAVVARALRRPTAARPIAAFVAVATVAFAAFVPILSGRYLAALAPCFALLVARELVALRRARSRAAALALAVAFSGPSLATIAGVALLHRGASHAQVIRSLRAVTGDAPVAGPVAFWLGYHDVPYTVTNVAPDFVRRAPRDAPWLGPRLARGQPRYLLETTTTLQATDGLGPRPAVHPRTALGDLAAAIGTVVAVIPSRDFGPVRVWRVDPSRLAGAPSAVVPSTPLR